MWLLEEPLPIFFLGILVEALLFGTLIHIGRRSVFVAMAAVLVLLLGLLAAEQFVVTDVESVEKTLSAITRDLRTNDVDLILSHVSSSASNICGRAKTRLDQVSIRHAEIKGRPEIKVNTKNHVKTAVATLRGFFVAKLRRGIVQDNARGLRHFTIHLRKEHGQWKVFDYQESGSL